MVLQFVGFVGGWQDPGSLTPTAAAVLCAALTTWATFMPSFLFILTGGPHVEKFSALSWLSGALSGITAAVVGVVLNLAVDFTRHALWPSGGESIGLSACWPWRRLSPCNDFPLDFCR